MSKPKRKRKFKPTFKNGGFWEHYKDLERQFEEFLDYVPYIDENKGIRSFKLTNILLNIGGHIDSAFKEMARYPKFYRRKNSKCKKIVEIVRENRQKIKRDEFASGPGIKLCIETFEEIYELSKKEVKFKRLPSRENIFPFAPHNPKTNAPYWWDIYNHTKHDYHEYFEKTNLEATKDALAGAFLLNAIHMPSVLRLFRYGVFKIEFEPDVFGGEYFREIATPEWVKQEYEKTLQLPARLETSLFIYKYGESEQDEYYV